MFCWSIGYKLAGPISSAVSKYPKEPSRQGEFKARLNFPSLTAFNVRSPLFVKLIVSAIAIELELELELFSVPFNFSKPAFIGPFVPAADSRFLGPTPLRP